VLVSASTAKHRLACLLATAISASFLSWRIALFALNKKVADEEAERDPLCDARNHCPVADHSPRACSYPLRPLLVSAMIYLPTPDAALVARRADIVRALRALVRAGNVIDDDVRLAAYETDA